MSLEKYLKNNLNIKLSDAKKIVYFVDKYKDDKSSKKLNIRVPKYPLGEEIFNATSHGIGALLSIAALILMIIKANSVYEIVTVSLFGSTMIILYTMSCIYHSLSSKVEGKKVLRVIDHCNVFLLVFGTYIPVSLLGIGGVLGWILFSLVALFTMLGIIFTAIHIDRFQVIEVICHLVNGWSILIGAKILLENIGSTGLLFIILGGIMYTVGSILYAVGSSKKYMHSIFHIFCLLGTFFHFLSIYFYLI